MELKSGSVSIEVDWPQKLFLVLMAIVVLTATGPFGTYREFMLPVRFVYWALAVVGVGLIMNVVAWYSLRFLFVQNLSWYFRMLLWVLVGAVPGSAFMLLIVALFDGYEVAVNASLYRLYFKLCMISATICLADLRPFAFVGHEEPAPEPVPALAPDIAAQRKFLNQLSHEIGDNVISISTQDHYLEVITDKGSNLILGKLSEVEQQLASLPGLRLHRSHWVALNHVRRLQRQGSGYVVILSDSRELPVSRSNLPIVRSALGL